jgi:tetratricopeptide (TPR) repeat protein
MSRSNPSTRRKGKFDSAQCSKAAMLKNPLDDFDYRVDCQDFLLYELGRLIDEDRVSFEDEEFCRVVGAGIHEHVERRLDVRAELARRLRTSGLRPDRTLRAIEDIESPLRDFPQIIQSYTSYLFRKLEQCSDVAPDERVTAAADLLLESPEDTTAADASIDLLGSIPSPVSARVLAHAVSEPALDEDLEAKAYMHLRAMWPLARHYILYSLKPHAHEDLPFRWFQLLIDCDEPSAVDRILEEIVVHGDSPAYREDLLALVELLTQARDPEKEQKALQILNTETTPQAAAKIIEEFLKKPDGVAAQETKPDSPWAKLNRIYAANRRYLAAAKLFDAGRKPEAVRALDELLNLDPEHPLALMLKGLL